MIAKNIKNLLGKSFSITITLLTIFQSVARFMGPTIFTLAVNTTQNDSNECILTGDFVTNGCGLENFPRAVIMFTTVATIIICIATCFFVKIHNKTTNLLFFINKGVARTSLTPLL